MIAGTAGNIVMPPGLFNAISPPSADTVGATIPIPAILLMLVPSILSMAIGPVAAFNCMPPISGAGPLAVIAILPPALISMSPPVAVTAKLCAAFCDKSAAASILILPPVPNGGSPNAPNAFIPL